MNHWFAKHGHSEKHKKYTQATQDIISGQKTVTPKSYPLVNVSITMENHHVIAGKIHYKYYKWSFSIANC